MERQRTPVVMVSTIEKSKIKSGTFIEVSSGDLEKDYVRDESVNSTPVPQAYPFPSTPRKKNNKILTFLFKWCISPTPPIPKEQLILPATMNLPRHKYSISNLGSRMPHMVYAIPDIEIIEETKRVPTSCMDRLALTMVKTVGVAFNFATRFNADKVGVMSKEQWVNRAVFLESVAAVPGMIAAMVRHLRSLRRMERDHGWIRHLLEEADNERVHLFFFLREKNPGLIFRLIVWVAQVLFFAMNITFYLISPKTMHRFVGYLEEEAVHTYNAMVRDIEAPNGTLREWKSKPAPRDMAAYYNLDSTATYRDIVVCIRADECGHREHNHLFSDLHGEHTEQHFPHGELQLVVRPTERNQPHGISLTEV